MNIGSSCQLHAGIEVSAGRFWCRYKFISALRRLRLLSLNEIQSLIRTEVYSKKISFPMTESVRISEVNYMENQ